MCPGVEKQADGGMAWSDTLDDKINLKAYGRRAGKFTKVVGKWEAG